MTNKPSADKARSEMLEIGTSELGPLAGQTLMVFEEMQAALLQRLDIPGNGEAFHLRALDAVLLIRSVRAALNPASWSEWDYDQNHIQRDAAASVLEGREFGPPAQVIWPFPDIGYALSVRATQETDWHHDPVGLRSAATTYLTHYWNHSPTLEGIFMSALAYTHARSFAHSVAGRRTEDGLLISPRPASAAMVDGLMGRATRKFVPSILWAFFVALVAGLFVGSAHGVALGVPTFLAFWVAYRLLATSEQISRPNRMIKNLDLCAEMAHVSKLASALPQVPTTLRLALEGTAAKGCFWPQELWQFVLRAEDRCRWALNGKTSQ